MTFLFTFGVFLFVCLLPAHAIISVSATTPICIGATVQVTVNTDCDYGDDPDAVADGSDIALIADDADDSLYTGSFTPSSTGTKSVSAEDDCDSDSCSVVVNQIVASGGWSFMDPEVFWVVEPIPLAGHWEATVAVATINVTVTYTGGSTATLVINAPGAKGPTPPANWITPVNTSVGLDDYYTMGDCGAIDPSSTPQIHTVNDPNDAYFTGNARCFTVSWTIVAGNCTPTISYIQPTLTW
jgi:hypothetical protein